MKYIFLLIILIPFSILHGQNKKADIIYINGKIWTGDALGKWANNLIIEGNKILSTTNNYKQFKTRDTRVFDLKGKMVVPGFIDNHTHFLGGGYQLASVNLRYVKSQSAFIAQLKKYVSTLSDKRWIQGGDWDHETWGGILPKRQWIDSVTANHPLFINRYDGHMVLVNSIALKLAGINKNTPDPPGGEIVKDESGEPTGILKDEAMNLVNAVIPNPSAKELSDCLQRGQEEAFTHGVTQVHDMSNYGGWLDLAAYQNAYVHHQLKLRIYSFVPIYTWQKLDSFVKKNGWGDDMLHWGGLKGFVDGSLGSTTAWFFKPYLDAPNATGLQVTDTILLHNWIISADSAGLKITVHAIGDRANNWLLNTYEEAIKINGIKDRRFRIEHAQHLIHSDIPRFKKLNIIASMQPYHAIDDGKWAAKRLDKRRLEGTYAFKSILNSGSRLTFGSDWTVAPLDPIAGIYAAVTRRTLDNKNPGGWYPEQKISVEQALQCYTVNNAFAGFSENKTGILRKGMYADFVVLSQNLFTISPEKIMNVKVLMTIINGKELYINQPK